MTRTVNEQALVCPEASVATQVTGVYPSANTEPAGGEHATATALSHRSVATGIGKLTAAKPESCGNSAALKLVRQVIVGGVVSWAVTVKRHWLVLPEASIAVQVTVLTPRLKVEPLGGRQTKIAPGQLSVTTGKKETGVPHSTFRFVGQLMLGRSMSST